MKLASVHFYPVKSTMGHDVPEAEVEPWGLKDDRRYLVATPEGQMLTAREEPRLLTCRAEVSGGTLTLTGPHREPLRVTPTALLTEVRVWRTEVKLTDCGDEAADWLSALLGRSVRLVWLDDPTRRPVNPKHGTPQDRVSLADGYPVLLASTTSLDRLNDWIAETAVERGEEVPAPLPMRRFRPNVVVSGVEEPFAEDGWKRVRIGEVDFRVTKPCDRCVLTTIDPDTLEKGKEPLRTLAKYRRIDKQLLFAVNLIPDGTGVIRIGDPVVPS
ncbi:MOSC domain-containing protein [Nonomuraea dietziae]|uniref:MOSC domain-containing protein n=2 Tax=Nonomuraea dietziae TaxID=65515 RepID=A0A7W5V806_9ACTN|nr:MOSC N-terminal beta barrel domain-containing protein [Nonomuraea dietziae]MBB3726630.1 hypothetical protein [Nonomuraea dietziae]